MTQLVWFKRDLRIQDNEALFRAAENGPLLPLYIIEPGLWQQPDMSGRHWAFLRESLLSLRDALAQLGQPLVVRRGVATEVLRSIAEQHRIQAVWSHQETGNGWTFRRDQAVSDLLKDLGIPWYQPRQHGIVRGNADRDKWSRQWERLMATGLCPSPVLKPLPGIQAGDIPRQPISDMIPDECLGRQRGGRSSAEQILSSFLSARGERYHSEMSSPLTATDSCSRLSAHLAWGTLSLREVVLATRRRRAQIKEIPASQRGTWSRALAAFEGRLHWHCHFMQKLESEPRIEFDNMLRAMDGLRGEPTDPSRLGAWQSGQTGWPFVDACMRALAHSGWINFRMRAMLVSVASYQLWLHWREPALHLARQFVDYEPGIHYPQVQMQSGTTGINSLRIYNPIKQSLDQDPDGRFIRAWVPELARVDSSSIHTPWLMSESEKRRFGLRIGEHYPAPLVDHQEAAREARKRIQGARGGTSARAQSREIYDRHGSRKRTRRRSGKTNPTAIDTLLKDRNV